MTNFLKLSGLTAITLGAALSMTAGLAFAGDKVSADQILNALQPKKPLTRGLLDGPAGRPRRSGQGNRLRRNPAQPQDPVALARRARGNRGDSRRPSRKSISKSASTTTRPTSARSSMPAVQELGKALSDASLKGSTFVVAGHTDAVGGEEYNQDLSERRADTIKQLPHREIRHQRHRSRHRRLWQDQAEGCERADGPGQPPRPGRQHGHQDRRRSNDCNRIRLPAYGRRIFQFFPVAADLASGRHFLADSTVRASHAIPQIQFWKIISRLNVAIDVSTNAAEIGSIAAKPAHATRDEGP